MRRYVMWLGWVAAIVVIFLHYAGNISASAQSVGFASATLAVGRFGEIDVVLPNSRPKDDNYTHWFSKQKTRGRSDLYVQSNIWQPGGSTGWHTHPGHSLIIVTAGTVTGYEGNDPDCKPHVYTEGTGFVDHGGNHVHMLRNETGAVAKTIAVQLVPAAATIRMDAADPGNCHF